MIESNTSQHGDLVGRQSRIEAEHRASVVVHRLLVIGIHQESHGGAGCAGSWLDHVRDVSLVVRLIEEVELLAGGVGVLGEIEVAPVRDAFQLIPTPRKQILDIAGA